MGFQKEPRELHAEEFQKEPYVLHTEELKKGTLSTTHRGALTAPWIYYSFQIESTDRERAQAWGLQVNIRIVLKFFCVRILADHFLNISIQSTLEILIKYCSSL